MKYMKLMEKKESMENFTANSNFIGKFKNILNKVSFLSGKMIWIILIPLAIIAATDQGIYIALLEQIQKDIDGYFTGGVAEAVYIASIAVYTIIFGYFADKRKRKWLMFIGAITSGVFYLLTAFTFDFISLIIIRAIAGIGIGSIMPLAFSMLSDSISTGSRSKAFSFWGVATLLGNGIGAMIGGGYVFTGEGVSVPYLWHEPFIYIGIIGIMIGILPLFTKEPKRAAKEDQFKFLQSNDALKYSYRIKLKDLKNIYKRRSNFWLVVNFIDTIAPGLLVAYILPYFFNYMTFDIILVIVLIMVFVGLLIGNFGLAFLADMLYKKNKNWRAKMAIICAIFELPFTAVALFLLPYYGTSVAMSIFIGINLAIGLTFTFGIGPNWYGSLIDVNLPENRGTMIATATFLDQIGRAIGTAIGGYIAFQFSLLAAIQSSTFFMFLSILPWIPVLYYISGDLKVVDTILSKRAVEIKEKAYKK
ncbi:MAG: MFS transporter [Promethearchaeota archaeon]|nr:MAG: MFS transporter [Candidatus Lokiarchaeota archaeon]